MKIASRPSDKEVLQLAYLDGVKEAAQLVLDKLEEARALVELFDESLVTRTMLGLLAGVERQLLDHDFDQYE